MAKLLFVFLIILFVLFLLTRKFVKAMIFVATLLLVVLLFSQILKNDGIDIGNLSINNIKTELSIDNE